MSKSGENTTFTENLITRAERAARIDRYFKERPEWEIPEIGLLKEWNWIHTASAHGQLKVADRIHQALRAVIQEAPGSQRLMGAPPIVPEKPLL